MGGCFRRSFTQGMIESFIDQLQYYGLRQLGSQKQKPNRWQSVSLYGSDTSRTESYRLLATYLEKPFKKAMHLAQVKSKEQNGYLETYVSTYLAHHVMRCLLVNTQEMPTAELDGLPVDVFNILKLPTYNPEAIILFQKQWTTLPNGDIINIDTEDEIEKKHLSTTLTDKITHILAQIDLSQLVTNLLENYLMEKKLEESLRYRTFASTHSKRFKAQRQAYPQDTEEHHAQGKPSL